MVKCKDCRYAVVRPDGGVRVYAPGGASGQAGRNLDQEHTSAVYECHWRPPAPQLHVTESDLRNRTYLSTFPLVLPDDWCAVGEPPR